MGSVFRSSTGWIKCLFWLRKDAFERKSEWRWAVLLKLFESRLGFSNRGHVTFIDPPKSRVRIGHLLEPRVSLFHHLGMHGSIHVLLQMVERLPHRKIE